MLISTTPATYPFTSQSHVVFSADPTSEMDAGLPEGRGEQVATKGQGSEASPTGEPELTPEQLRQVQQLESRDREVKAHEAAHMAAASGLFSGDMSFTYQIAPNGRRYAIGGEVSIDSSPISGDPQATVEKVQQIVAAAMAPVQPSSQDRAMAALATRMAAEARIELELLQQRREETGQLPVNVGSRNILDVYRSANQPEQASVLDQTV